MKTIVEVFKETIGLIIILGITDIALKLFFRKTFIGKTIFFTLINIGRAFKLILKGTKHTSKFAYKVNKKAFALLNKHYKVYAAKKQVKQVERKVVNGSYANVIDLKKFMTEKQNNKSR